MTENQTETEIEIVVPEGKSLNQLTVAELSWCSKRLGSDVLTAVTDKTSPDRAMAFAYVATAWARRADPKVEISRFAELEFGELMQALGMRRKPDAPPAAEEDVQTNPTDSAPA